MEKVSILIATYHRDKLLNDALNSVLLQTYTNWEAIVVDNGGNPQTRNVVKRLNDPRILYINAGRNLGECAGRNLAFANANGDLFCYLDDDDLLPSESLTHRLAFYKCHPACGMIYGDYRIFRTNTIEPNGDSKEAKALPYFKKNYYDSLLKRLHYNPNDTLNFLRMFNFIRGGTPLIRREVLETVGLFDERFIIYGDYEMWLRIASRYAIRSLDKIVYHYRIHSDSTSMRFFENQRDKSYALLLCWKHNIKNSVQFAHYQADIYRLWNTPELPEED